MSRLSPNRSISRLAVAAMLGILAISTGCSKSRQARTATPAGFLGDYSMLQAGEGDQADLVYLREGTDFSKYTKVMLDSVTMWRKTDSKIEDLSKEQQQALCDYFYSAVYRELSMDYTMVERPGPGTLRIRLAITEAEDANATMDVITTIIPQLRLLSSLGGLATDTAYIVGEASAEGEITDAASGVRLVAAVDRRIGAKALRGVFNEWSDVQDAFDKWAVRIRESLAELRAGDKKP